MASLAVAGIIGLGSALVACGSEGELSPSEGDAAESRSSGQLAYSESAADNATDGDAGTSGDPSTDTDSETESAGFIPAVRADGLQFLFADGALGPARLGATIDEISDALGSQYKIAPESQIRVDFPSGYSVSLGGEVLFWAIEEDGIITTFMTSNRKVGLESGLRPRLPFVEAVELHGEPTLFIGTELREFVRFADGTGDIGTTDGGVGTTSLSVLVAIGQFGGPVGVYSSPGELGSETTEFVSEDANIKELWFQVGQ